MTIKHKIKCIDIIEKKHELQSDVLNFIFKKKCSQYSFIIILHAVISHVIAVIASHVESEIKKRNTNLIIDRKIIFITVLSDLEHKLLEMIARVMVVGMYSSESDSSGSRSKLKKFIKTLLIKENIIFLFNKYPVLENIINNFISNYQKSKLLFFTRLINDFEEILYAHKFNSIYVTRVISINGMGDQHNGGGFVKKITCETNNKKLFLYTSHQIA